MYNMFFFFLKIGEIKKKIGGKKSTLCRSYDVMNPRASLSNLCFLSNNENNIN